MALARAIASLPAETFDAALDREARARLDAFLSGIERYRSHPYRRRLEEPPVVWTEGGSRLLDFRPEGGSPVLVVPSLVNTARILDLDAERSLMRFLARAGLRPLLLDWGVPGEAERAFGLDDYIAGRGVRALAAAVDIGGGPVAAMGYCMGGLLALALAQLAPDRVEKRVLLATPWDFLAVDERARRALDALSETLEAVIAAAGVLPVDVLQCLFYGLDPTGGWDKFRRFSTMAEGEAEAFVAVEDWANDGVPLAGAVARECLRGWYGRNTPARGAWCVAGAPVEPAGMDRPALVVVPGHDRIVPPGAALPLAERLPGARVLRPASGHIGMVIGGRARRQVWEPLAAWLGGAD